DGVLGVGRIAAVLEAGRQTLGQPQHPIRRPQQQATGVAGDGATVKGGNNRASFSRCKCQQVRVTLCRHRGLPLLRDKALSQKNFRNCPGSSAKSGLWPRQRPESQFFQRKFAYRPRLRGGTWAPSRGTWAVTNFR